MPQFRIRCRHRLMLLRSGIDLRTPHVSVLRPVGSSAWSGTAMRDVFVLQRVGDGAPRALTVDEPERPKLSPWVSQAAPRAG